MKRRRIVIRVHSVGCDGQALDRRALQRAVEVELARLAPGVAGDARAIPVAQVKTATHTSAIGAGVARAVANAIGEGS